MLIVHAWHMTHETNGDKKDEENIRLNYNPTVGVKQVKKDKLQKQITVCPVLN